MSKQIYWLLVVEILPGQLESFRSIVQELIASAKTEPRTLGYDWNLSADESTCHIYERYENSADLLTHGKSFHAFADRFFKTCRTVRCDIYGTSSDEVKAAVADLHPTYYTPLGGFNR